MKWVAEWLFIGKVLKFLNKTKSIFFILLVQVLYPFYVTLFGLVAQKPVYVWKDRELRWAIINKIKLALSTLKY